MTADEIRTITDKLDNIESKVDKIETCLKGYNGEGLVRRVGRQGNSIKWLAIGEVIIACAVLGIDKLFGVF